MATKITSVAVVSSTVDSTPIGSTTPATGRFTTPASGDNSTNAATTAWALLGFSALIAANGYVKFPAWLSGLMMQWGQVNTDINAGTLAITFPAAFPSAAFAVLPVTNSPTDRITYVVSGTLSTAGFTISNNGSSGYAYWFAVGN